MRRTLTCVAVGLLLTAGVVAAQNQAVQPPPQVKFGPELRGQIVNIDPKGGIITIRTGEGNQAVNQMYRVNRTTRYFDNENKTLNLGLAATGFRQGGNVWYRAAPTTGNNPYLGELRLGPTPMLPNSK